MKEYNVFERTSQARASFRYISNKFIRARINQKYVFLYIFIIIDGITERYTN